jgi:hypothetical protein
MGLWSLYRSAERADTGDVAVAVAVILVAAGVLVAGFWAWCGFASHRRNSGTAAPQLLRAGVARHPVLMARLSGTRNLHGMSMRWRFGLVAIIAAAVVSGFLPHGALSGADASATQVVRAIEAPLSGPSNCEDATCGKGNTAPASPSPGSALVAIVAGLVGVAAAAATLRRHRGQLLALPTGARDPLFHPPKFS